jgi:NitT/TauT family transport system substrate-binding protein
MRHIGWGLAVSVAVAAMCTPLCAEVKEVILGEQYGAVYLPAMVMENQRLVEKHLSAAGLGDVKVAWVKLGGPAAINDAMISGSLHFACQGVPSLAVIWDRTKGGIGVKALGAVSNNNNWLNTRNPNIHSLKDFTDNDRIAVPSLKVAAQTILMHIAAEKVWGRGNHNKLDHLFVALPNPEGMAAVLSKGHEVNANFTISPFHEAEMKAGLTTVTSAFEIMGGPTTGLTFTSSEAFHSQNPRVFASVNKAFDDSFDWINADKRRAAKLYIEMANEKKLSEDDMLAIISGKDMEYTKVPSRFGALIEFMYRTGYVKNKPDSWKDLFFEEAHSLPGS